MKVPHVSDRTLAVLMFALVSVIPQASASAHDEALDGRWRAIGLTTDASSALSAQVCLEISGGKAAEHWFMYSPTTQAQQQVLDVSAIEVKYKIDASLTVVNASEGTDFGAISFEALRVYDISVDPAKFLGTMTDERKKSIGKQRHCMYQYLDMLRTRLKLHCSSTKPANGFYRYGDQPTTPTTWPAAPVVMTKGSCNQLNDASDMGDWSSSAGFRVHVTFAGTIIDFTSAQKLKMPTHLGKELSIPEASILLASTTAGSFIVNLLLKSHNHDPQLHRKLQAFEDKVNGSSGQRLGDLLIVSMSFEYYDASRIIKDPRWELKGLPIWALVILYTLGTVLYGTAVYLVSSFSPDSKVKALF